MAFSFDIVLVAAALGIMIAGFARHRTWKRIGRPEDRSGNLGNLIAYLLVQEKIMSRRSRGIAHIVLFWGVIIPLVLVIVAQFSVSLPLFVSGLISLLLDILGLGMLIGILYFIVQHMRHRDPEGPQTILFPLFLLLFIILTGFLAEGTRLNILHPSFTWQSPIGWGVSFVSPDTPLLMQVLIRLHFYAVLLFIALVPFTALHHTVTAPLNIYYKRTKEVYLPAPVDLDRGPLGASSIYDFTWKQLLDAEACVACGRCEDNCPAFMSGKPLSPRKIMRKIREQLDIVLPLKRSERASPIPALAERISPEEIWACTMCLACMMHCPVYIEPMDRIMALRRLLTLGRGMLPVEAREMVRNLEIFGDVYGRGPSHREDWSFNRSVSTARMLDTNFELLLWVGCAGAFHPRYQEVTRAMVSILKTAGINFCILGKEELCCGDTVRRLGEERLFLELAQKNIRTMQRYHIDALVALCPHCFHTLKHEYPFSGYPMEVTHAVELIAHLIDSKRISLKFPVDANIAVHDPCYLGRANGIYDPLRTIITSIPGATLNELHKHGQSALCCGGGGGRMWLHETAGHGINRIRAKEIMNAGVEQVATACPYCMTMLDDGLKAEEPEQPLKVFDIIELVAQSLA